MKTYTLNRYEYLIHDGYHTYTGSYTIKADKKPLGFEGEILVATFVCNYVPATERPSLSDRFY